MNTPCGVDGEYVAQITKTKVRKYKLPKTAFRPTAYLDACRGAVSKPRAAEPSFSSRTSTRCVAETKPNSSSPRFRGGTRQERSAGHAPTPFTFHVNESQSDSLYRKRGHKEISRSFHKSLECSFRVATSPWAGKDVVTGSNAWNNLTATTKSILKFYSQLFFDIL
jgi:hypothetical protein